jgi:hypothetical protein
MDEHIQVAGQTVEFSGELVDHNLNTLSWWIDKHNRYSSLEALELLNLEFSFKPNDPIGAVRGGGEAARKRWIKEHLYAKWPGGIRAFTYFVYRYVIRLGFLDGREGAAFHFLQGWWYRFLVDCKVAEVKRYMRMHDARVETAIEHVLHIKL